MTINRNDPNPPLVLVFAAADPTGGAGIQADIMTLAGMGCHALTVITALTVQDTAGVEDVLAIDADFVAEQALSLIHIFGARKKVSRLCSTSPRLVRISWASCRLTCLSSDSGLRMVSGGSRSPRRWAPRRSIRVWKGCLLYTSGSD